MTTGSGALRALIAEVEPLPDATAEESTTRTLRRAILQGVLAPGDRLRQERLAAELGVSRIPLRDAFRRLEAEGLIRIDGRRGARVASLSVDDVIEAYELRRLLEVGLVRLAINNLTDEGADGLVADAASMDIGASHGISHRVRGWYAELYGWSGRPRTVALVLQLRHELHRYHALKDVLPDPTIHERIVACVRERDADGAARIMREHLRSSRDALVAVLRREARERGHGRRQRSDSRR